MTNQQFLEKIVRELDGTYQLGLHSVCKDNYDLKVDWNKELYHIDKDKVTEEDIISKILTNGLNVYETCIGLSSTVGFIGNVSSLSSDVFDYVYWNDSKGKVYNVVVVIPQYICINGRNYFIGDATKVINIANFSLFYSLLPKEFIYGYYVKNYISDEKDKFKLTFGNELEFFANLNFYDFLSDKEEFWMKYLEENKLRISLLEAANYPNIVNWIFQNYRNRIAINATKKQIKKL